MSKLSGQRRSSGPARKRGGTPKKAPLTKGDWAKRVLKWTLVLGLVGSLLGAGALVFLYKAISIPDPNEDFETQTSFIYYADGASELGRFATQNRESITLKEMPQNIQDAVVAAENRTFWTDKGIDPKGILRAAFNNASGNSTQGASTITQQYVKILYLTQERSLKRKLKEAVLSLKIQRQLSKSRILEGYLNTIYFGRGAYGIQAAANAYFDIDAKDLSLRQAGVLATVLNNPTNFDPANGKSNKRALKERYRYVIGGMADLGSISQQQADKASKRLPAFPAVEVESQYGGQRGHMLKLVKDELHALGYSDEEIDGGGLRVTTTFTPEAMKAAAEGVAEAKPDGFGDKELHIGVASVEPDTGALRGFYAGQDYLDSQINWAVAGGMVGSTMKPFTLATALDSGYSLKDTFEGNSPYEFPDGLTVQNEGPGTGNDYGSAVTATYATQESINTAYVDMSNSIPDGPDKILEMANRMGIPLAKADPDYAKSIKKNPGIPMASRDLESDALLTLGKARISPINMANAYATLANKGERADVHVIDRVVDRNGEELWSFKQSTDEAMDKDVAADTSYALQQVVKSGTGRAALALSRPAAGKTGTATNDQGDVSSAWFVGYTPQLATAVMYVRGDGDDKLDGWLPQFYGAVYPAQTWTAVMQRAMEGLPVEEFPPPANLDGEAPESGHAAYTPPPKPTRKPSPTKKPSETASETPTKTPSAPPSSPPPSTPSCGLLGCDSSSPPPSSSSPPSSSPPPSSSSPSGGSSASGGAASGGADRPASSAALAVPASPWLFWW